MSTEKDMWQLRHEAQSDMYKRIPRGKFGVVGVDSFDQNPDHAGEDLYLVGIYATREEAEVELASREAAQADCGIPDRYYIYEGEG